MEHLNNFKLFENKLPKEEFVNKYLDKTRIKYNKYGEIIYSGTLNLSNKNLDEIPVKFKSVEREIRVSGNNLKTFEFLPEFILNSWGSGYIIHNNDFEGKFKEIFNLIYYTEYDKIYMKFIQECLSYEVWNNGRTNEMAVEEAWFQTKLHFYNEDNNFLYKYPELFDFNDKDIFMEVYSLDEENWIEDLIGEIIDDLNNKPKYALKLLYSLVNKESYKDIKQFVESKYDLTELSKINLSNLSDKQIRSFANMMYSKAKRDESKIDRDENYDLFVFIAGYDFIENEDGSYKKVLDIEKLIKIDLYNQGDLNMISKMKLRARFNNKDVYMIWMPKGVFNEDKQFYLQEEIPDYLLKLIDKKKTKV